MTSVEFHTGVADPVGFACRLLRKAYRQGLRVAVTAPAEVLAQLDQRLWTFEERDFVPHVRLRGARAPVRARTPVWLVDGEWPADAPAVQVNLSAELKVPPAGVQRLVEIVGTDAEQVTAARGRWKAYQAGGLSVTHLPQREAG